MIRDIHLHGRLGRELGRRHRFAAATTAEAVRFVARMLPGGRAALERGDYQVFRGPRRAGDALSLGDIHMPLSDAVREIHIMPVAAGRNRGKAVGKILVGAALVGVSFALPGAGVAALGSFGGTLTSATFSIGVGAALSGVGLILSPSPATLRDQDDGEGSTAFNGTVNTTAPGAAIPVVFGELTVGSVVVSVGVSIDTQSDEPQDLNP